MEQAGFMNRLFLTHHAYDSVLSNLTLSPACRRLTPNLCVSV